jgi:hypothetical protein
MYRTASTPMARHSARKTRLGRAPLRPPTSLPSHAPMPPVGMDSRRWPVPPTGGSPSLGKVWWRLAARASVPGASSTLSAAPSAATTAERAPAHPKT